MGFLTKRKGMDKREAREVLDLAELVAYSLDHGPVPLERYARIRRCEGKLESHERNARALVARLKALGYVVKAEGDAAKMTLDFGQDAALRGEVARSVDEAQAVLGVDPAEDEEEAKPDVLQPVSDTAIGADYKLGLDIRRLCRRYGIHKDRVQSILFALRVRARQEGRPPVERRRSSVLVEEALKLGRKPEDEASRQNGRVAKVARLLACDRTTAWRFLKRFDALH